MPYYKVIIEMPNPENPKKILKDQVIIIADSTDEADRIAREEYGTATGYSVKHVEYKNYEGIVNCEERGTYWTVVVLAEDVDTAKQKRFTYLVNALSSTEANTLAYAEFQGGMAEFEIVGIKKEKYCQVFNCA